MKILSIEASGLTAGCAFASDGRLISEYYMNNALTHSTTLLPMIEHMQKIAGFELEELDCIAVSKGPGSFTGLRIGAATAKGLGLALSIPLVGVSSLEAMAANLPLVDMLLCPMMDARQNQVYGAMYRPESPDQPYALGSVLEDQAMPVEEFLKKAEEQGERFGKKLCFLGDGVPVHEEKIRTLIGDQAVFAPTTVNRQRAASVAMIGARLFAEGKAVSSDDFAPDYARKPLAQTRQEAGTLPDAGKHSLEKLGKEPEGRRKNV